MVDEMRRQSQTDGGGGSSVPSGSSVTGTNDYNRPNARNERAESVGAHADEKVDEAKSATSEVADRAKEMADGGRESAAGALDRAASSMKDRASGDGMPAMAAGKAAEGMEAAASYMKERDTSEMWDDIERYVKEHPMQAVAAAVATGIVVGRVLR